MTTKPEVGSTVRARIGTRRPVEYIVIRYLSDDIVLVARPSRKNPGDFFGGTKGIPLDLIELDSHKYAADDAAVVFAQRCRECGRSHRDPVHNV